jgi:OmpA-OmpF porin, OOP family
MVPSESAAPHLGANTLGVRILIKKNIAIAALGLAISGAASAQVARPAMAPEQGLYVGVGIGQAEYDACGSVAGFGGTCDESDQSYKLFVGYDFNRNFAAEIGYVDLGGVRATGTVGAIAATVETDVNGFELVGVGKFPITQNFSLIGKLGVLRWDADARVSGAGLTGGGSDTGTDVTFGFGLRYTLTRSIGLQADWQRYRDVGSSTSGSNDIDVLGISLLFKF